MERKPRVLVVEDEELNQKILTKDLESNGYEVATANDGEIACNILKNDPHFDVILLDRMMPNMDGMEALKIIKYDERTCDIPVIMQTALSSTHEIQEGIDAGVFYYLTKPYEIDILLAILKSSLRDSKKTREAIDRANAIYQTFNLINHGSFSFRTFHDVTSLSYLVSNFCYEPEEALVGINELMINAIEHGNLGIHFKEKTRLLLEGKFIDEINNRLENKEYSGRWASLHFEKKRNFIEITIEDEGDGFDWEPFMEISPERATLPNGRGIAVAKMISFHSIEYIGKGNKVVCGIMGKR